MANPTGVKVMKANGKDYRLHLGMSVLAELQEKYGDAFESVLTPVEGKMPSLRVVHDIFLAALQRYHSDEADRWLVDDIVAQNLNALVDLLTTSFPDASEVKDGEGKKRAAA